MQGIRGLVLDLDGTLLDDSKKIGKELKRYLIHLQKDGIKLILASGRRIHEILDYSLELEIDKHNGCLISCNGQYIYDAAGNLIERLPFMKPEQVRRLVVEAGKKKYYCNIYCENQDIYIASAAERWKEAWKKTKKDNRFFAKRETFLRDCQDKNIEKVVYSFKGDISLETIYEEYKRNYGKDCNIYIVDKKRIEFSSFYTDKYFAVKKVLKKLSFTEEEVLAFGDSYNDILMMKNFKNSVCMENGEAEVKKYAKDTALSNNADGVLHYLKSRKKMDN